MTEFFGFSAIDIYVWVCFSFVILSLLEFALADYWHQVEQGTRGSQSRKLSVMAPRRSYYYRNEQENGGGIVHHNCSNCDYPEREVTTLLSNNNAHLCSPKEKKSVDWSNDIKSGSFANIRETLSGENEAASVNNGKLFNHMDYQLPTWRERRGGLRTLTKSAKIDLMARWIFPTSFLIFNVFYWSIISWHL